VHGLRLHTLFLLNLVLFFWSLCALVVHWFLSKNFQLIVLHSLSSDHYGQLLSRRNGGMKFSCLLREREEMPHARTPWQGQWCLVVCCKLDGPGSAEFVSRKEGRE